MIELFKQTKTSMKFDRMIPSGSSWLMGIKTQRLVDQAHAAIKPGKSIPIWKFHQMTGHTGEYLMKTTADYMGIKLTGKLDPCETCAQAKIRQANIPKKKEPQVPSRPGYRLYIDISSFKHESMGGKRHWLIVVDEFSDCSHSFFLNVEKSVFSIWVDLLLCRSIQLLVLSYAEMFVYMYLSQLMSTFTNYLKVHHLLDGIFNP